jgi:hypothetical protein
MNFNFFTNKKDGLFAIVCLLIGAILTYFTENLRKNKEEKKILLKKIYFKIYTEIKYCFLTQNAFRKEHKVNKIVTISELNEHLERLLEENIGIIDKKLFNIYHKIKSQQYFIDNLGGIKNYEYLAFYGSLLKNMLDLDRSVNILNKYFKKDIEMLFYEYVVWFGLMKRIKDWKKVENILNKDFHFKRSYKTIAHSIFLKNVINNFKIDTNEFISIFEDYCKFEIAFPVLNKYFWLK